MIRSKYKEFALKESLQGLEPIGKFSCFYDFF